MNGSPSPRELAPTRALSWAFAPQRLPAFMITLSALYTAAVVTMLVAPAGPTGFGAFAEEFKVWCFGYDPATRSVQPMYVVTMLMQPIVLSAGVLLLFGADLRASVRRAPRAFVPASLLALAVALVGGTAVSKMRAPRAEAPLDALRTALPAPTIRLVDQTGAPFDLAAEQGRVVLLTSVYASCTLSCPMILAATKRALAGLTTAERSALVVAAVTLDPEHDDAARLLALADAQQVSAPSFRLLTGAAPEVNAVLDGLQVARKRDPATGLIDHANLFVLVDKKGRIAYRFSLGEGEKQWLLPAVRRLLAEAP